MSYLSLSQHWSEQTVSLMALKKSRICATLSLALLLPFLLLSSSSMDYVTTEAVAGLVLMSCSVLVRWCACRRMPWPARVFVFGLLSPFSCCDTTTNDKKKDGESRNSCELLLFTHHSPTDCSERRFFFGSKREKKRSSTQIRGGREVEEQLSKTGDCSRST